MNGHDGRVVLARVVDGLGVAGGSKGGPTSARFSIDLSTTLTSGCRDGLARNRHDRFASNDGKIFLAFGVIASRGWSSVLALV